MMSKMFIGAFCVILVTAIFCRPSALPPGTQEGETWGPETNGLRCSLQSTKQEVCEGEAVQLLLKVCNVGKVARRYHVSSCCGPTFEVIATFQDGSLLNFIDLEQQEHHPHPVIHWIELGPGEVSEHNFDLRIGQFMKQRYVFIDPELGVSLHRNGELTLRFVLSQLRSNAIKLVIIGGREP